MPWPSLLSRGTGIAHEVGKLTENLTNLMPILMFLLDRINPLNELSWCAQWHHRESFCFAKQLMALGYVFKSDTDTEVICPLGES